MTGNLSLRRKVIYLSLIVLLLIPLYWLGQPSTGHHGGDAAAQDGAAERGNPGGKLAQMRIGYGLAQSELGDIDPASESMKLATLGLRGVAANLLWSKSIEYKKKEQWDKFSATLNQITKLQPNFYSVWEFQAHNLSYNVSVEFDDYRYRYHWVKKGIDFLERGTRYNRNEPRLFYRLGWYMGQKLGRSDEMVFFRQMFREDTDFHRSLAEVVDVEDPDCSPPPRNKPDNWLVGAKLYERSYQIVDGGAPLRGQSPHLFYHSGALSIINYAVAVAEEGWFDMSLAGWERAAAAYQKYGDREVPTSWGTLIKLNDREKYLEQVQRLEKKIDELAPPGLREKFRQQKIDQLTDEEKQLLEKPWASLSSENFEKKQRLEQKIKVRQDTLALKVDRQNRRQALRYAREAMLNEAKALHAQRYREQANYDYWVARCAAEQRVEARQARELMHDADEKKELAELSEARRLYEQAWDRWAKLYADYPILIDDPTASDVTDAVGRYLELLELEGVDLPEDFKLVTLLEFHREDLLLPTRYRQQIDELIERRDQDAKTPSSTP